LRSLGGLLGLLRYAFDQILEDFGVLKEVFRHLRVRGERLLELFHEFQTVNELPGRLADVYVKPVEANFKVSIVQKEIIGQLWRYFGKLLFGDGHLEGSRLLFSDPKGTFSLLLSCRYSLVGLHCVFNLLTVVEGFVDKERVYALGGQGIVHPGVVTELKVPGF